MDTIDGAAGADIITIAAAGMGGHGCDDGGADAEVLQVIGGTCFDNDIKEH